MNNKSKIRKNGKTKWIKYTDNEKENLSKMKLDIGKNWKKSSKRKKEWKDFSTNQFLMWVYGLEQIMG